MSGYQKFAFTPKDKTKGTDIGDAEIELTHFSPGLFQEIAKISTHTHSESNSSSIKTQSLKDNLLPGSDGRSYWFYLGQLIFQGGWDWIQGDGVNRALTEVLTFPVTFRNTPFVMLINTIGYKTGSDPTGPDDTGAAVTMTWDAVVYDVSTSQLGVEIVRRSADGADPGVLGATNRYMYSWFVIGT